MKSKIIIVLLTLVATGCQFEHSKKTQSETSIEKLLNGNKRFVEGNSLNIHHDLEAVKNNSKKQHPFAVVLTCSDSRVDPDIIFDQGIGDLFIVKNAGNVISDIDFGSIEYAVEHLNVKLIVVMGHTDCGAVKAFVGDKKKDFKHHHSHIDDILDSIDHEKEIKEIPKMNDDYLNSCIKANTLHSANSLLNDDLIKKHKVQVVQLLYDVKSGKVSKLK
jgi:carbonic anhydrase